MHKNRWDVIVFNSDPLSAVSVCVAPVHKHKDCAATQTPVLQVSANLNKPLKEQAKPTEYVYYLMHLVH